MSPGYGEKIYTKRPAPFRRLRLFIPLILVLIGLAWLISRTPSSPSPRRAVEQPPQAIPNETAPLAQHEDEPNIPPPITQEPGQAEKASPPSALPEEKTENAEDQMLARGKDLLENRQFQDLISLLLPLTQHSKQAILLVAEAYYELKNYSESRDMFERYLEMEPNNLAVIRRLVSICYALNELDEALLWCEKGLQLAENDAQLRVIAQELKREQKTSSDFISRESEHFVVSFDRGEHADARQQVLSILEDAYREVGRELGVYPERLIPVILYTQKAFFDVTRAPGWAGGLYDGKIRMPIANLNDQEAELTRILTHEYVHAVVHQITNHCPHWINEGLAELFSQSDTPEIGQLIPLARLERGFPSAPDQAVAVAYAQSHAAVAYLIDRYSLNDLITLLKKMGEGSDFRSAFREVYQTDLSDFLGSWGL